MNQFSVGLFTEAFVVNINASIQYQKINGFGGAFTDAAGINIAKLSAVTQTRLLKYISHIKSSFYHSFI